MDTEQKWQPAVSSFLVAPAALGVLLGACLLSLYHAFTALSFLCGFAFILCGLASLWGRLALKNLVYSLELPGRGLFPGERFEISRILVNQKYLPLAWLEILEPSCGGRDSGGCVQPLEDRLVKLNRDLSAEAEKNSRPSDDIDGPHMWKYLYQFSLVGWQQSLRWTDTWVAKARGIHGIEQVYLCSGDGFGLCSACMRVAQPPGSRVVIYPALTEVAVERVLDDIWDAYSTTLGYLEDESLIRTVRDYRPGDPGRRINQRLLARGQGLKVNQFEIVAPEGVLFIFDTASFAPFPPDGLETALSLVASLIVGLGRRRIATGLWAPATAYGPETRILPGAGEEALDEMLTALAAAGAGDPPLNPAGMAGLAGTVDPGQVYYVTGTVDTVASGRILNFFPAHKVKILQYAAGDGTLEAYLGYAVRSLRALGRAVS